MLAVELRREDKSETNSLILIARRVPNEEPDILKEMIVNETPFVAARGYQFKADGKTLDISISFPGSSI